MVNIFICQTITNSVDSGQHPNLQEACGPDIPLARGLYPVSIADNAQQPCIMIQPLEAL